MTKLYFVIKKFTLIAFIVFSVCHTPYFVTKMEKGLAFVLTKALPSSSVSGITPLSLTRWHIETLSFKHPTIGHYQASDLFFDFKLWPLVLGKCHLESLVIKDLKIFEDPDTPLNLTVFNSLYQNRFFVVSKLHIASIQAPILPHQISLNFLKKANLNFLEIYDTETASHASFEIASHSPFLKFQSDIVLDLPQDSTIHLKGSGSIKDKLCMELKGLSAFSGKNTKHPLSLNLNFDDHLELDALICSDHLKGTFFLNNSVLKTDIECHEIEQLFPQSELSGHIHVNLEGLLSSLEGSIDSHKLYYKRKALGPLNLKILKLNHGELTFEGAINQNSVHQTQASGQLFIKHQDLVSTITLKSATFDALIKNHIYQNKLKELIIEASVNNLNYFESFFDKLPLNGHGNLYVKYIPDQDTLEIFSHFNDLKIDSYYCHNGTFCFLKEGLTGQVKLDINKIITPYTEPFHFFMQADKNTDWEGICEFKNKLSHLKSALIYQDDHEFHKIKLHTLTGHLHNHPLHLSNCIDITKKDDLITICPFNITSGDFELSCSFLNDNKYLKIKNLSLEGLKTPYFDAGLEGLFTCEVAINNDCESTGVLNIKNLKLKDPTSSFSPMYLQAQAIHQPQKQLVSYAINTYLTNDDFLFAQGSFPFTIGHKEDVIAAKASHHFINFKYDLKDLGKILNMGASSLGGKIQGDLHLQGHRQNYTTLGHLRVNNLHAGFPLLGIFLDQGFLDIKPQGKKAEFFLKIADLDEGQAEAKGVINLENFAYQASCHLEKIFLSFKKTFFAKTSGDTLVEGDFTKIKASGALNLEKSGYELSHPEIKKNLSYKIEKITKDLPLTPKTSFQYDLVFNLETIDPCKIKGIGLDSDWQGQSLCHIANDYFSLKGTLHCKKGDYKLNTKKFNIDEGVIHLEDFGPSTILAKGTLEIPQYQIKVNLIGPLNAPRLQFSSLPHLSENAIFSYILFNKPISELHPFQSIELAQTLMELSGDKSPVSLSKLRSNLSIDALEVKTSDYDQNKIALHIGKYITPSFLVGLNQTTNASDVLVQLEFKHGFILKAESQEQKEGKFSFKWRKSF